MNEQRMPDVGLDRLLADWLEADAAPRAPESLETAFVEGVASTRQRPAWATTERWISMETRAQLGVMPRVAIVLLTIALLAIGAVGGYAMGSGIVDASDDGGDPLAGLTYSTEGVVYTMDGTGEPVPLTGEDEYAQTFAWSPDGTRFSYESWVDPQEPITIVVRDADGSNPITITEPFEPTPRGIKPGYHVWSPDGSKIVYWALGPDAADEDTPCVLGWFCGQRIWIAPTDGSEPARVIGDPGLDAWAPVWTPDGESIIFGGSPTRTGADYGLYRMDADGENVERIGDLAGDDVAFEHIAISPDGTTAAVTIGPQEQDLYLVDLATGDDVLVAGSASVDEFEPYWSPDSSMIAFTTWGATDPLATLYDVDSGEVIELDIALYVWGWSSDGRSIFGYWPDGVMTVVDVTDPMAPVATVVDEFTETSWAGWQPRP
jgi:Tol biopolymer transport system component